MQPSFTYAHLVWILARSLIDWISMASEDGADASSDAAEGDTSSCDPPALELHNNTGNAIEIVRFDACDMSDGAEFPVPPPGVLDGESATIAFPGPGCWVLGYEGEGCFNVTPEMVEELECGETHVWTVGPDDHICQG